MAKDKSTWRKRRRKTGNRSLEQRIRAIEDRLEIYNLIAGHPPSADTGADYYTEAVYTEDGVFDRGANLPGATGNKAIAAIVKSAAPPGGHRRRDRTFRRTSVHRARRRRGRRHFVPANPHAQKIRRSGRSAQSRRLARLSHPSGGDEPLGAASAPLPAGRSSGARSAWSTVRSPRAKSCAARWRPTPSGPEKIDDGLQRRSRRAEAAKRARRRWGAAAPRVELAGHRHCLRAGRMARFGSAGLHGVAERAVAANRNVGGPFHVCQFPHRLWERRHRAAVRELAGIRAGQRRARVFLRRAARLDQRAHRHPVQVAVLRAGAGAADHSRNSVHGVVDFPRQPEDRHHQSGAAATCSTAIPFSSTSTRSRA